MFAIAVVPLILAAVIVVWVVLAARGTGAHLTYAGLSANGPLVIFVLGAVAMALVWVAFRLAVIAGRRGLRRRRHRRTLERETAQARRERDQAVAGREPAPPPPKERVDPPGPPDQGPP